MCGVQQAKVQDLHRQIEDLKGTVESLQLENTSLQSQNSILQKVLAMRDEQINVMQEESKVSTPALYHCHPQVLLSAGSGCLARALFCLLYVLEGFR